MKIFTRISRFVLGPLFIFSGFVKALDPLGSAYKFSDYFDAFSLGFMEPLSLGLGIFLAAFELVLGMVILLGFQKKISYWVLLVFMSFFTVLTFILALTNPVSDCGCFGDAIIMTNWQTFLKNVVFMIFVLILFRSRSRAENVHANLTERGLILLFFAISIVFSSKCLQHLPVIDFRPYSIGTDISEAMKVPEGAELDQYSTILYYKNIETGKTEEFTIENYPTDTLQYSFVTSESKLVSKGYEPPIHDFGVLDPEGQDVTDLILDFSGYSLFLTSPDIEEADIELLEQCNDWVLLERMATDFQFIPLTASTSTTIESYMGDRVLNYSFYSGDEIMLKTMVRSNPGFFLLKNGTIVAKWSAEDFPALSKWNEKWPEMLEQLGQEQDPEIAMLIEEGLMEELTWDLIDFDRTATVLVAKHNERKTNHLTWISFLSLIILLLVSLQLIPQTKERKRG